MQYVQFHEQGLFVDSGVVGSGCKTLVVTRLKRPGMRWTVDGGDEILGLRSCTLTTALKTSGNAAQRSNRVNLKKAKT